MRKALNHGANDDEGCTRKHTPASAKPIDDGSDEGQRNHATNLVHGRHDARPDTAVVDTIFFPKPGVLKEIINQRAIVAVHRAAEEADEGKEVDEELASGPGVRGVLDHGFLESFVAANDLGFDFSLNQFN